VNKIFVLDTNVLLHDCDSITSFDDNQVVIPLTALEELDKFKNEPGELGANARAVARKIDELRDMDKSALASPGVVLENGGTLRVYSDNIEFSHAALRRSNDNYIIGVARRLKEWAENEGVTACFGPHEIILVTNDINMRCKADALGIVAQPYFTDKADIDEGVSVQAVYADPGMIDKLYELRKLDAAEIGVENPRVNGCYQIMSNMMNGQSALCRFSEGYMRVIRKVDDIFHIKPRNAEQRFLADVLMDEKIECVICNGIAGTGKTLLSMAAGLEHVVHSKKFNGHHIDRIMITKVVMDVGNGIGFLPGDLDEKMEAWVKPFTDNLEFLLKHDSATVMDLKDKGQIEVDALCFIRGRSLMNRIVVVDECQNLTPKEIKTLVTRIGNSSKLILLGDLQQIDSPYLTKSNCGLAHAMERMQGLSNVAILNMTKSERSALAAQAAQRL